MSLYNGTMNINQDLTENRIETQQLDIVSFRYNIEEEMCNKKT